MRICLYTETAFPSLGEQEIAVDALARQFQAAGHAVVVLTLRARRAARCDELLGYPVVRHPRFLSKRLFLNWYRRHIESVYRTYPFNVLHCHNVYPAGRVAQLWAASRGIPLVLTSHARDIAPQNPLLRKPRMPLRIAEVLGHADAVVAINKSVHQRCIVLGADPQRVARIPTGVDYHHYATSVRRPAWLNEDIKPGRYVLVLGRLVDRSGVDPLLAAYQSLIERSTVHLVIAGDERENLLLAADGVEHPWGQRVHLVGAVQGPDRTYLMQNALCTVIPARTAESAAVPILESYAAAVPVVTAQVAGLEDLIHTRVTGLMVPMDSPTALADALAYMTADRARAHAWGLAAQTLARKFDWRRIAEQHLELYASLSGTIVRRRNAA